MTGIDWGLIEKARKILIIDDAIDSGKTIFQIKELLKLKTKGDPEIFISVISWTLKESIVQPDAFVYKGSLIRFPWSKDYKGEDFEIESFSS